MAYRNKAFYISLYRQMDVEKAYAMTEYNLRCPSFAYERQNVDEAWLEVYGYPFMSPEQKKYADMEAKVVALEAEKDAVKPAVKTVEDAIAEEDAHPVNAPIQLDRKTWTELFLAKHPQATKMVIGKAWKLYKEEVGITE
jgi:hypothetical protein